MEGRGAGGAEPRRRRPRKGKIDKERVSLSANAGQFATMSGLQSANVQLLGQLEESIDPEDYGTVHIRQKV
jgi:hypothetical protein